MAIAAVILELVDGPERGRIVRISNFGPTLIGRGVDTDIRLPAVDSSLSRHQAYIDLSSDCCVLTRVAGSNRVVEVNHRSVDHRCTLTDGDVITLGATVVRIALLLTDTACLICGEVVEDGPHFDRDHSDVSILAHESCVDLIGPLSERFGQYEACELIREGPAEQLYRVYDRKTRRMWALKRLTDISRASHFQSDLQQLLAVRHPNIIRCVRGDVEQEGVPFLVTEFASGGSLSDFIGQRGPSPKMALQLIDDVLEALKFLHSLGKAHGNLHPRSIVLQREALGSGVRLRSKLVDLGITNGLRSDIPATDARLWRPPEHASGPQDQRDDVYSAAAVLYFLLARQPPVEPRVDESENRSVGFSGCADYVPLATRCPTIRPVVGSVIDRACHKDPAKRFRSAQQLQVALRDGLKR